MAQPNSKKASLLNPKGINFSNNSSKLASNISGINLTYPSKDVFTGVTRLDRKVVIDWLEAVEEVDKNLSSLSRISKAFRTYGQDHRIQDVAAFQDYLAKHEENGVYQALLQNQRSLDLD